MSRFYSCCKIKHNLLIEIMTNKVCGVIVFIKGWAKEFSDLSHAFNLPSYAARLAITKNLKDNV